MNDFCKCMSKVFGSKDMNNQELFNHMANEHGLSLLESELRDIELLCNKTELKKLRLNQSITADIMHNMIVGNQAAWIEYEHGKGARAGMQWIENGLAGPGMIPNSEVSKYHKDAQLFYSEQKSNPFPICPCGNPSMILSGGNGYCCNEHQEMHKDKLADDAGKSSKTDK